MLDPCILWRATPRPKLISISHRHLSKQVERMLLHTLEQGSSATKEARRRHGLGSASNSRGGARSTTRRRPQRRRARPPLPARPCP